MISLNSPNLSRKAWKKGWGKLGSSARSRCVRRETSKPAIKKIFFRLFPLVCRRLALWCCCGTRLMLFLRSLSLRIFLSPPRPGPENRQSLRSSSSKQASFPAWENRKPVSSEKSFYLLKGRQNRKGKEKKIFQCQIRENLSLHSIMEFNYDSERRRRASEARKHERILPALNFQKLFN